MATMTKNGIATAESVTYYNSMLNDLSKSGTTADKALKKMTKEGFGDLIKHGKSVTEVLGMLDKYAQKNKLSLKDMFSTAEGGKAALTIMKNGGSEYNEILKEMAGSAGTTETAFKKMDSTPAEKLAGAWNKVKNSGIELGESLIPLMEKGANYVSELADRFSNLSESQQESIGKTALFVAALGPMLTLSGKAITVGTSLVKVFGKISTAAEVAKGVTSASGVAGLSGGLAGLSSIALPVTAGVAAVGGAIYLASERNSLLNQSVLTTKEQLPLVQRGWNALSGSVIKSKDEMDKLGLTYQNWSSKVSPSLQKSCEDTANSFSQLNFKVASIADNGKTMSKEMGKELVNQTQNTCNEIIAEIEKHESDGTAALKKAFAADGKKDWYEDTVLAAVNKGNEACIKNIKGYEEQIVDLYKKYGDDETKWTQEQKNTISKLYQEIGNEQLKALSSSNDEYQEALANFQVRIKGLDLKGASDLLQQKASARDTEIKKQTEHYDTLIQMLRNNEGSMSNEEKKAAEASIKQFQDEKDKIVGNQKVMYKEMLNTIEKENPEIYNRINWHTGKINDDRQQKAQDALKVEENYYKDLGVITDSGYYNLYDKTNKTYEKVYAKVDDTTGRVIGIWNTHTGHVEGCTDDIANSLRTMEQVYGADFYTIKRQLSDAADSNTKYTNNQRESAKNIISSLEDINDAGNGVYEGTLRINGKPIKVTVNKDGTIRDLQSIVDKQSEIHDKTVTYSVTTSYHVKGTGSGRMLAEFDGSHYNGLENVPYDGYTARLHKNERILTAEENKSYTENKTSNAQTINFNGNYSFADKKDIDYFLNQAALKLKGSRG